MVALSAPKEKTKRRWIALILFASAITFLVFGLISKSIYNDIESEHPLTFFDQAIVLQDLEKPEETPEDRPVLATGIVTIRSLPVDMIQGYILGLKKTIEYYSWFETKVAEKDLPPPPVRAVDRYKYHLDWSEEPSDWQHFGVYTGHKQEYPEARSQQHMAGRISIGRLHVDIEMATIYGWQPFDFGKSPDFKNVPNNGTYLYNSETAKTKPVVGDTRLKISYIPLVKDVSTLTVLGRRDFNKLVPFITPKGKAIQYVCPGSASDLREAIKNDVGDIPPLDLVAYVLFVIAALFVLTSGLLLVSRNKN